MMSHSSYSTSSPPRSRLGLIAFAIVFLAGAFAIYWTTRPQPTVEQRINEAFAQMQSAAKRSDIAGATEILSSEFRAGEFNKQRVKLLLFQARRENPGSGFEVLVSPPEVLPSANKRPDERLVITRVTVKNSQGATIWSSGNTSLTLVMREEKRRVWLFFSVPTWRIVSVPSVPAGLGGF